MRRALRSDLPVLSKLWARCFDDLPARVDEFWDLMFDDITVYVHDDLSAMAVAMPMRWQARNAAYLYAVCTAPEARGKGLCRTLLQWAEDDLRAQGISYALLVPAEPHLFAFYEKLGYRTVFYRGQHTYRQLPAAASPQRITPAEYGALRSAFLPDAVEMPLCLLRLQNCSGALYALPDGGCAAAEQGEDGMFIRELLSNDKEAAAASLAAELELDPLPVYVPDGDLPHGMAKSLDGSPLRRAYLGLAFG